MQNVCSMSTLHPQERCQMRVVLQVASQHLRLRIANVTAIQTGEGAVDLLFMIPILSL